MKWFGLSVVIFAFLVGFPPVGFSQEPALDLAVTDIIYDCDGDTAYVSAEIQLAKRDSIDTIITEVNFYRDGEFIGSVPYDVELKVQDPCEVLPPPCNTVGHICLPTVINGHIVTPSCWELILFDPPISICVCVSLIIKGPIAVAAYAEPVTYNATVDESESVDEWDEANNDMTIVVGPSSISGSRWGLIKSLYR